MFKEIHYCLFSAYTATDYSCLRYHEYIEGSCIVQHNSNR